MKRYIWILFSICMVFTAYRLESADIDDFAGIVDFAVSLKQLSENLQMDASSKIDPEKFVILHGSVSSISFLNTKKPTYEVQLELVSGEWIGLEEVKSYRCRIVFRGPEYYALIPRRVPRNSTEKVVVENTRVIVVGKLREIVVTDFEGSMWLLDGYFIRTM